MSIAEARAQKLQLIEWLTQLEDEETLKNLVAFKRKAEVAAYEDSLKPMSVEELVARAEESNRDIAAGRVYDLDDVIKEEVGE